MVGIGHYSTDVGWDGWVETKDWILFHRPDKAALCQRHEDGSAKGELVYIDIDAPHDKTVALPPAP